MVRRGPKIATDGLILYIDPRIPASYPGSGNLLYDLSGRGYTHTIAGGGGSWDGISIGYDGNATYSITTTAQPLGEIAKVNHTLNVFAKFDAVSEEDLLSTGGVSTGHILLMVYNSKIRGHVWSSTGAQVVDSLVNTPTGVYRMVTQRVIWGGKIEIFENGVLQNGTTIVGSQPTITNSTFVLGSRTSNPAGSHFDGNMGVVQVYNRALSNDEILWNFNTLKIRYGI